MSTWRITWFVLTSMLVLSACVREEEALLDDPINPPVSSTLSIAAPAAKSSEATAPMTPVTAADPGTPTATGGDGNYTFSNDAPSSGLPLGMTMLTWTVQDGAGATASATQTVTVVDSTRPMLTKPADLQVAATGAMTMVDIGTATATDLVDMSPTISNDMPGNGFPVGTTGVMWNAVDASGNSATAMQMVTVTQGGGGGPLTIAAPANIAQEATAPHSNIMLGAAMASGGQPGYTITNDAPANGFPVGSTSVVWTVTDAGSMTATATQTVTLTDTTAPNLTAPADVAASQGPGLGNTNVNIGTATANDLVDPNVSISNNAPAGGFPVGDTTVTWSATDASGNTSNAAQTVTVVAFQAEQCSALLADFQNVIYPIMNSANPSRCVSCHTGATPLPTPNGFAFSNNPPDSNDLDKFRTVARINSGGQSLIIAKATNAVAHTGGNLFPDGDIDPDFVSFSDFVERARNCQTGTPGGSSQKVVLGTGYEQLHKIVSSLGARVPTQGEVSAVAAAGDQAAIDTALTGIMDGLMNEDAFYMRVEEMYNDLLLTNMEADDRGPSNDRFDLDAFANRDYYETNFDGNLRSDLRQMTNYGIARAPIELISYVIRTNRPFTEILTADYLFVNPYSAVIYGVDAGDASFPFSSDQNVANHDRDDFRRVNVLQQTANDNAQVPLAGVLSTHAFLARYPSTNTNVNRARGRYVFDYFLGIDIEGLASRDGLDLDNVIGDVPTYEDPQCTVCHEVLDPIAGLFTKRDNEGEYDLDNRYEADRTTNGVPRMVPPGYSTDPADAMPNFPGNNEPLKFMVQKLAADDRFADKTVRTVLYGLTGIRPTSAAGIAFANSVRTRFVASNFNFKSLVKDIILSDYYRASNLDPAEAPSQYADMGTGRILTPEELYRRIRVVAGGGYEWRGPNSGSGLTGRHYLLYGGIDSDEVTTRTVEPTSLMDGIQERIANQVACERVANDLLNDGSLFPIANVDDTPATPAGVDAITANLVHLHRLLLGEDLADDSTEISWSYQLFLDARAEGETAIPNQCRGGGGSNDTNGTILPWMAVVTYLLSDYRFVYE